MRIVIDTDPGIDDVVTLALAAASPTLDIGAIVTSYGNATLDRTTFNARHVLRLCGRDEIPVIPGCDRPLRRPLVTAPETHGESGVGHADVPGAAPAVEPQPRALLDVLAGEPGPVTLVTLGPLTNLATAIAAGPDLVRRAVGRHIGMFGNLHERGNTNRWADFNAWCDPEAVASVLGFGLPTEMVGLDVTRRMVMTAGEVESLSRSPDPLARWLADALRFYVEFHRSEERLDGCVVNDVLTVGELTRPGLLAFETRALKIVVADGEERGRTVESPDGDRVQVALDVDIASMRRLLDRVFGSDWDLSGR